MANDKQHGFISKTVGLSLGFVGIVGLVVSLVALLPVNLYNIVVSVNALAELLKYENKGGNNTGDWWWWWWTSLSPKGTLYTIFLTGSILSSLITIVMVLATACRQQPRHAEMASTSSAVAVDQDIEGKRKSSVWLSRMGCLIFVGQISWALFGTHILFFFGDDSNLPDTIRKSTMISVLILWLNYLILTVFSFILFCASFFIILGVRRRNGNLRSSSRPPSTTVGEEMQYHREETTPLLNSNHSL